MLEQLKELQPFRPLQPVALAGVAKHAKWLRLPAQRWLKRHGQVLKREMFLIEGRVAARCDSGVDQFDARILQGRSLNVAAPDATEISTVTAVAIIAVDLAPVQALLNDGSASGPAVADIDDWMHALLKGPIMRWFSPGAWAKVLRAGRIRQVRRGECVLSRGEVGEQVFVVVEGVALSAGERFPPGDFFGEESALGRQPAHDDVVMQTDGVLACFDHADVVDLAADYAPPRTDPPPRRFDLDLVPPERENEALAALDPLPPIALRSIDPARRLRVAARLMRQGFTVV